MDFKGFIAGCVGGFAGIISSYPFDTIKVRIQNQSISSPLYRNAVDCFTKTIKKESASALYKGMSSPLVGSMFINALLFGVEDNVRKYLHIQNDSKSFPSDSIEHYKMYALSGAIAGFTQAAFLSPVELVKIRMQMPNSGFMSTWKCCEYIYANQGLKGVMRGTALTIIRDVPAVSSYFIGFEYICNSFGANRENLSVAHLLAAGGLAGCLSWLVTYPIDVVKTRYQADNSYTGMLDCLRKTLKTEGHMGFWRGLAPTLLRAFPNNASVFATVTLFNRLINDHPSGYHTTDDYMVLVSSHLIQENILSPLDIDK